ncbi:MAG: branched-chain amino acid ABC transporter permease [Acidimicrobiales bacterium]
MFGRPNLYTSYEQETKLLPTWTQKLLLGLFILVLFLMPFDLPIISQIPVVRFLGDEQWLRIISQVMVLMIAALGLNLLSGVAGQVSLGHAFFMGVGACTAVYLGGEANSQVWGHGLPVWVWLPAAGIAAALVGILVSPIAVRVRGLYLAIVTLGLVFVGIHLGNMAFGRKIAGPPSLGREFQGFDLRLWREETPLINMSDDGHWLWFDVSENQKKYFFFLVMVIGFTVVAKNIVRSRTGRALQAIRDRDIAAEVMGVPEFKYKVIVFAISSFFAGIAGAMFAGLSGQLLSDTYNLLFSVEFIAMILIGGAGTTSGTLIGVFFVVMIPRFVEEFTKWLGDAEGGVSGAVSDALLTTGGDGDFGIIASGIESQGWPLSVFDWNVVLFGVLIIVFLIFEPLGLFGIWVKARNYWKRWPFSY